MAKQPSKSNRKPTQPAAAEQQVAKVPGTVLTETTPPPTTWTTFPIVGIGTSAGGLEALEQFLRHVPKGSGMAYVVVQHLDPTHKGMLPELLGRFTDMPVYEVSQRMLVKPECVYVIPPNKDLLLRRGALLPLDPDMPRGLRLPVDRLFQSLAEQHRELCAGVILSGMGSDGTLGVRAIKEHAGLILVQEPTEAGFDGMPRSAIAAGVVDIVAAAQELPARIIAHFRHAASAQSSLPEVDERIRGDLDKVLSLLRLRTGRDFSQYKKNSVCRRIERRMSIHQLDKVEAYARYVREHPQELDFLFKELLIGVTSFFRDPEAWAFIKAQVIPALLAEHPGGRAFRAWVPACSTGEEPYSLAMVFQEALEEVKPQGRYSLQIFATDLDRDAVDKARKAVYPANVQADLGTRRLGRFFHEEGTGYRMRAEIREMVTFAPHDVLFDPPFTKLDFLCCRNLLIYLGPQLQKKLIALFHYSLNPGGVLFLGGAETIGGHSEAFVPLDPKIRLFRRRDMLVGGGTALDFPTGRFPITLAVSNDVQTPHPTPNLASLADQALLQRFCPAAVLVNETGDIVYISGRTGKYLEPATGQANWNIHAMAREGLRGALTAALHKAARHKESVLIHGVTVGTNGGTQIVDVSVQAIDEPLQLRGMLMIVFTDVAAAAPSAPGRANKPRQVKQVLEMEQVVRQAREESRRLYEDMQTTQEELKSANEELQSINEELTTSREEMQSMNEELQTVNAELQSKVDELTRTSNDMKNLLDSTDIATVFLNNALHVRRFTTHATDIFKLLPGDVNRPLSDIVMQLDYPQLEADAREVLRTLVYCEKQIPASNGRWFKVRVMPYRTIDNMIDGVVITFSNITEHKELEAQLRHTISVS